MRPMTNPSLEKKIQSLRAYSKSMIQAMRVMDQRRYILQPLIDDRPIHDALASKINRTSAVTAYNHLVPLFSLDFVRDLARLFLDRGRQVASLENVWRKATEQSVYSRLRNEFGQIPEKWYRDPAPFDGFTMEETQSFLDEMLRKDKSEFLASFDEGWLTVEAGIDRMKQDPVSDKIRQVRDKYQAHFEMTRVNQEPEPMRISDLQLKYEELSGFADCYLPIAYELNRIITDTLYDISESTRLHSESGRALWIVLADIEE